jgi:hypothetical protein
MKLTRGLVYEKKENIKGEKQRAIKEAVINT